MRVRVKVCGVTSVADAELAASLGADLIGLNFYVQSPRCIAGPTARAIVQSLPASCEPVALFVRDSIQEVQQTVDTLSIRTVQLHGSWDEGMLSGIRRIQALGVREQNDLHRITAYLERARSSGDMPYAVLIDASVPGLYGGTGQTAPWHLLADFKPGVPLILAGGLTPENVAEAIRIVKPYAVDVASGVESTPGKKDVDKMRRFIDAVRSA
jgi:phosphoribosylanthranilate isomerase